jgi:transcriptional regulator
MYLPKHFEKSRLDVLQAFIHANPFAMLVENTAAGLVANHIPMELEQSTDKLGVLGGHIARAKPLCKQRPADAEVPAIFRARIRASLRPLIHRSVRAEGSSHMGTR